MRVSGRALFLAVVVVPVLTTYLPAQGVTTAAVVGTVVGPDSAPVSGALLNVTNTATGERWQTSSGSRGRYVLEYLSLGGPYLIEARAIGFAPASHVGVRLSLGERRHVDFVLGPAVVRLAEVAVVATVDPLVNSARTGPGQTYRDTIISRLPVRGRDFAQMVYLSPQAVLTPSGGVSIAGQSDRLNGFQVDGTTNLDLTGFAGGDGFGTPGASSGVRALSVEALRELQVLSAPFDVRYAMFAGGLVSAVTRSGSNRWEGSISGYFEDRALTGKDSSGQRAADFSTKEFALTLAGPIVRDRAAFFLDLGLQRDLIPQAVPGIGSDTVAGADSAGVGIRYASAVRFQKILRDGYGRDAGSFASAPRRLPSGNLFAKVTLQPAVNHRVELSYNHARGTPEEPGLRQPYGVYSLTSNAYRSPAVINATRITWATARGGRLANHLTAAFLRVRERCDSDARFPEVSVGADEGTLVAGLTSFCEVNISNQEVWELTNDVSWYAGTHQLTVGTHSEVIRTRRVTLAQPMGRWEFSNLDSLAAGRPEGYFRTLTDALQPEGPVANLGINQVGFYAQDRWLASARLTLTAGLRVDVPFLTSRPVGNPLLLSEMGIDNTLTPSGNPLWSPRLGFSYDLGGRGFLRGGVGLFAGRPAYHWLNSVYGATGLNASELFCGGADVPAFTLDPAVQPAACGAGAFAPTFEVNYFNPSFRFPRNLRLSLGTDFRLPMGVVATADILYIRGVNQYSATDVNLRPTGIASGEGGRVMYGAIDPSNGDATPNRQTMAFGPVIEVRNASGDRSFLATVQFQKRFTGGGELGLAYTYTDSRDRMSASGDLAAFNIAAGNVLDGTLDERRLSTSLYSVPHKITAVGALALPWGVRLAVVYNGLSGSPFTYRVLGDANADAVTVFSGAQSNDPVYLPRDAADITLSDSTEWEALDSYINGRNCLDRQRGRLMRRNSCRNPWVTLLNARLSKVIPTAGGQSIEVIADFFNVLNLLDGDWGVRRSSAGSAILALVGYDDARGRGIYRFNTRDPRSAQPELTRWRLQLGARYSL